MLLITEPYKTVIAAALQARGSQIDDFTRHPMRHEPNYVVRMCEKVRDLVERRGGRATLESIMRVERCASGHADYHAKFALYCAELEVGARALA